MKKAFLFLAILFLSLASFAQAPQQFNFQGAARNVQGDAIVNQNIRVRLSVLSSISPRVIEYSETRNITTNAVGLFNIVVGSPGATNVTGTVGGVNWPAGSKYLLLEMDPLGGSNFLDMGTTQFQSVPFAFNATNVTGVVAISNGGTGATTAQLARINLGLGNVDNINNDNQRISKDVQRALDLKENLSNKSTITSLGASDILYPTQNAVKTYVDAQVITAGSTPDATTTIKGKVQLAGDLGGPGTVASSPVISNNAITTIKIADANVTDAKIVSVSGSKVTGNITGNAANVTGIVAVANGGTGANNAASAKVNLGLGDVDNTSDAAKPISTATQTAIDLKANIASPALTGTPLAPTATAGTNTTQLATTSFVTTADNLKANLASPTFTGNVTAPTFTGALSGTASGNLPLTGGTLTGTLTSNGRVIVTGGTGTAYNSSPIEIVTTLPRIAFHWPGVVASQLGMNSGGVIRTFNNPGTGYEKFAAADYRIGDIQIVDANRNLVNIGTINTSGNITAPTFIGALTGNAATATTATTATNLAAGLAGQIPYQSAAGTTAMLANGTAGQVLQSNGTTAAPTWAAAGGGSPVHSIGESYGGGIVFYVYDNGQHGLIAATADQSTGIQWYNGTYRYTGTTGDGLGAGAMNTAMIVATQMADNQTGNFAAKVCADYSVTVGGVTYGDWYLPSKYELNLLYLQKTVVGGFASGSYWSSSENGNIAAWYQGFGDGSQDYYGKNGPGYVRAVRAF